MSIYATLWTIQVRNPNTAGETFVECWAQAVPNHINEENGYGGPGWDEWLPPFKHGSTCRKREYHYFARPLPDDPDFVESCTAGDEGAMEHVEHSCDCGPRCVFICDSLTTKSTDRNGQEYVNPVFVIPGRRYAALRWGTFLRLLEDAIATRHVPVCQECQGVWDLHVAAGRRKGYWCVGHAPKRTRMVTRIFRY